MDLSSALCRAWHWNLEPVIDFRFMCSQFLFDPSKWPRIEMDEDFRKISKMFNAWKSVVRVPNLDPKYKIAILASKQVYLSLLCHKPSCFAWLFEIKFSFPIEGSLSGWLITSMARRETSSGNNLCCKVNFLKLLLLIRFKVLWPSLSIHLFQ